MTRPASGRLLLAILLGALALGSGVGLLATAAWLISKASLQPPILELTVAVVSVRAFGIGRGVFRYAERLVGHDAAFRGLTHLRVAVMERCAVTAPGGLAGYRDGDLLARLVGDVNAAVDLTVRVVIPAAAALLVGLGATALAGALLPAAGLVMAAMLFMGGVVVPWITAHTGNQSQGRLAPFAGQYTSGVVTTLGGLGDLTVNGAANRALAGLEEIDRRATGEAIRAAGSLGLGSALAALTQGAAVLASLALGVSAVNAGELAGVNLAVVTLLPLAAYEAVVGLPAAALALVGVRSSARRVLAVIDTADPVPDPSVPLRLPSSDSAGDLVVRGLTVRYPGAARPAVTGLDLRLSRGRRTALVGPSGAGKSTVAAALMRFVPYGGDARLAGVSLDALSGDDVRSRVGLMRQDGHLFDTSLAVNLRIARPEAGDDELLAALDSAQLRPWLSSLPHGLETAVGAHGSRVSGGQKRRLSAAQILLAGREIVILDEPTEHLDAPTAEALMGDLLATFADRSVLLITHRPEALERMDDILYMERGEVVERGTHRQLIEAGGPYAMMWALESIGEEQR